MNTARTCLYSSFALALLFMVSGRANLSAADPAVDLPRNQFDPRLRKFVAAKEQHARALAKEFQFEAAPEMWDYFEANLNGDWPMVRRLFRDLAKRSRPSGDGVLDVSVHNLVWPPLLEAQLGYECFEAMDQICGRIRPRCDRCHSEGQLNRWHDLPAPWTQSLPGRTFSSPYRPTPRWSHLFRLMGGRQGTQGERKTIRIMRRIKIRKWRGIAPGNQELSKRWKELRSSMACYVRGVIDLWTLISYKLLPCSIREHTTDEAFLPAAAPPLGGAQELFHP